MLKKAQKAAQAALVTLEELEGNMVDLSQAIAILERVRYRQISEAPVAAVYVDDVETYLNNAI